MQKNLTREDIVGKRIRKIWQTPWETSTFDDGYFVDWCSTFLELEDGTIFEIMWQDCLEELPILRIDSLQPEWIETTQKDWFEPICYNMEIREVLTSKRIPTFVLFLANNYILYASDYGPHQTGPLLSLLGESYPASNFVTYWGHKPLEIT